MRDRERGVPRYNQFRRLLNLSTPKTFETLTNDSVTAAELKQAYNGNIEDVDLLIGSLAEARPDGFGFGDTPFQLFLCMANRRLKTDRYVLPTGPTLALRFDNLQLYTSMTFYIKILERTVDECEW